MMKWKHMAKLGFLTIILGTVTSLAGCGSSKQASSQAEATVVQDPISVKIADITTNPVLRVAKDKGIFKKYGIDAEIVTFATPAEGINSLFIKQVDVAWGAEFPVLNAVSKGDYAIIASTGLGTEESAARWQLFVKDSIQKPEDLKGKKLSNLRATFVSYLWDTYLGEHSLTLKDVKVIDQGGFDEAYIALKKGEVDAAWVSGSAMIDKFKSIEGVHQLTNMAQTKVRIGSGIIVTQSLLKDHPQGLTNLLKALDEGSAYLTGHQDEVADILYKEVKLPKEAVLHDLPFNTWHIGFDQAAFDSFAKQKKYMVDNGIIKTDYNLETKLHLDFVKQAFPDRVTYKQ